MTHEALMATFAELPAGEARFTRPSETKGLLEQCERDGYVIVDVPELRAVLRGRLGWLLEEAIERSLELRGACRSGIGAGASLESCLTDQLYRARLIGARGLTVLVPTLDPITNRMGALDPEDSATLRSWICAAKQRPVRLYLDVADCMLGAYLDPVTLTQLMHTEASATRNAPPVVVQWSDDLCSGHRDDGSRASHDGSMSVVGSAPPRSDVVATAESAPSLPGVPATPEADPASQSDALVSDETASSDAAVPPRVELQNAPSEADPIATVAAAPSEADPAATVDVSASQSEQIQSDESASGDLAALLSSGDPVSDLADPRFSQDQSGEFSIRPPAPTSLENELLPDSVREQTISLPPDTRLEMPSLSPSPLPPPPEPFALSVPSDSEIGATLARELDDSSLTPIFAPAALDLQRSSPVHDPPTRDLILPAPHPPTIPVPALTTEEPVSERETRHAAQAPLRQDAPQSWRSWMERLDAVHGPKPLNFIEQSFVEHYVPLYDAYHRGIAGEESRGVLDQWATSFSQSYSEAFDAMRLRGRRPTMVLDIAETAHRLGRLHGARAVQLVLVDGMRYDLGLRVERLLSSKLAREAVLTDKLLLWSALPSTTTQQLELLARPESLRDGDTHSETPVLVARGRSASTLRRVRVGSREILKLDLVEARLNEPGGKLSERLDLLAVEIADALALAVGRLQPRTLVTVFGDHGFCLDVKDTGTSAMRQGGSSPDEVFVPAYAWLTGQMH